MNEEKLSNECNVETEMLDLIFVMTINIPIIKLN